MHNGLDLLANKQSEHLSSILEEFEKILVIIKGNERRISIEILSPNQLMSFPIHPEERRHLIFSILDLL